MTRDKHHINTLEGIDLAVACARASGLPNLRVIEPQPDTDTSTRLTYSPENRPPQEILVERRVRLPGGGTAVAEWRPDLYIGHAWQLDGAGWEWDFHELRRGLLVVITPWDYETLHQEGRPTHVFELWRDHDDKERAYATARSRAFLLMKAQEREEKELNNG